MKSLNYLLAFAIAILFLACESPREENNTVVLSGKIENPNTPFLVFTISDLPDSYDLDTVFLKLLFPKKLPSGNGIHNQ